MIYYALFGYFTLLLLTGWLFHFAITETTQFLRYRARHLWMKTPSDFLLDALICITLLGTASGSFYILGITYPFTDYVMIKFTLHSE